MVASTGLQWLVSQSMFLIRITILPNGVAPVIRKVTCCGWSSIGVLFLTIYGSVMLVTLFVVGFKKLDGTMPLASQCSTAISAAYHPPATDKNAGLLPVRWGALKAIGEEENGFGHCALTSEEVDPPVEGRKYAGF